MKKPANYMTENDTKQIAIIATNEQRCFLNESLNVLSNKFPELSFTLILITYPSSDKLQPETQDNIKRQSENNINTHKPFNSLQDDTQCPKSVVNISLTRDFGLHANLKAGIDSIDTKTTDAAIIIFSTGITPDTLIKMINTHQAQYDAIFAKPTHDNNAKIILLDKKILTIMQRISEPEINIQDLTEWIGFKQTTINLQTHIPTLTKLIHKIHSLFAHPSKLLAVPIYAALTLFFIAIIGWLTKIIAPLEALALVMCALILSAIALVGTYVTRMYSQSLKRPLYIISEKINFNPITK